MCSVTVKCVLTLDDMAKDKSDPVFGGLPVLDSCVCVCVGGGGVIVPPSAVWLRL